MYYAGSITAIRAEIERRFPGTEPNLLELVKGARGHPAYILWMCKQIEEMDISSIEAALKAARWIGWVFAHVELYAFWDNSKTRDLTREDVRQGLDKPHRS